ncbi:MAG: hypothetical protein OEZ22_12760, partial [Spirochaetia bacterium]|nr:hypothetical protein [Spirochaetia bacterium]
TVSSSSMSDFLFSSCHVLYASMIFCKSFSSDNFNASTPSGVNYQIPLFFLRRPAFIQLIV